MRKTLTIILFLPLMIGAQNLVPNSGFEEYHRVPCDCMQGDLSEYIKNWQSPAAGTPDIITDEADNDCYASCYSKNNQSYGTQAPHGGHGMGMIMTTALSGSYREYLGVQLKAPLIPGKKYYAEMYVSLGDKSGLATNNLGMCFFDGDFKKSTSNIITATPQVNSKDVVDNYVGWVKISGTFVADAPYRVLVIGNFLPMDETDTKKRSNTGSGAYSYMRKDIAAYFVDDILVRQGGSLEVHGDTLVNQGAMDLLTATGSTRYAWADTTHPATILSNTDQLNMPMNSRRTFYVYGDDDTAMITVNVRIPKPDIVDSLDDRKVKKGRTITVTNDKVTITVYDKDELDGDSISLWYGDSCLVQHYALTKKKKEFVIHVDKNHPRQLILFAENEGRKPPNTAAFIITDGKHSDNLVLSSDMKSCDSVMLVYKEPPK
ncbi:MAG TPA: hypothetical protein VFU15_00095 [Bacteroidia bacterium]|nr:hypothetical protein [Bacteroidia bacterium]